jgi:hypothetical protein
MICDTFEKDDMKLDAEFDQEISLYNRNAIYHELADVGLIAARYWIRGLMHRYSKIAK